MDKVKRSDIDDLFRTWKNLLGLHDWTVSWQFFRGSAKKIEEPSEYHNAFGTFEGIEEEQKVIFIKLDPNRKNMDEFEHTIIHELWHALLLIVRYPYEKVFDYMLGEYTGKPFTKDTKEEGYPYYKEIRQVLPFIVALEKLTLQETMNVEHPLVKILTDTLFNMKKTADKYQKIKDEQIKKEMKDLDPDLEEV